jgi:glycosyltransferase involved in cell wall biosynthesis
MVYPIFALRRLINRVSGPASVRWYRHWHMFFVERSLRRRLSSGQPLVLYSNSPEDAAAALRARKGPQQKVVMAVHFWRSQAQGWLTSGHIKRGDAVDSQIRDLERRTLPRLDGIVYVSDFGKREIEDAIPAAAQVPNVTIPNFVDLPERPNEAAARDAITIGTLEKRKNQAHVIEVIVIAAARALGRDITLTVVGDGPDRRMLEQLAADRGVGDLIDFPGFVKDASRLIPQHRVYVHAALMEILGIAMIEALASGRPIVSSRTGGTQEVFDEGKQGYFWPLDDAVESARILISLLDDPARLEAMSCAARQRFEDCFATSVVAESLAAFLRGTVDQAEG